MVDVEPGGHAAPWSRERLGERVEAAEVDAVAEQRQLVGRAGQAGERVAAALLEGDPRGVVGGLAEQQRDGGVVDLEPGLGEPGGDLGAVEPAVQRGRRAAAGCAPC